MSTMELHDRVKSTIAGLLGQAIEPQPLDHAALVGAEVV
jgi:hypothetical protein